MPVFISASAFRGLSRAFQLQSVRRNCRSIRTDHRGHRDHRQEWHSTGKRLTEACFGLGLMFDFFVFFKALWGPRPLRAL